ncbi:beta-phosphoglucomutase family hydrolase [Georgenia muralis]|uniref:HAD superfamily hydrolase (TIGR01509 family)/beta-phosphoglucomutase family hydrolase n=1 Tax=Georgenia muralis TaxID=154117 RepID=A0A3N4ZS03_9MICO|nr:beta-phosphoglucomutase family hydrolase [Georgenia muralis]RPF28252.1 HAD superfamily hydrolase (TIGR01509 family)/beta-phosphoglucomutase family hydrolase [Georgenia muralis]
MTRTGHAGPTPAPAPTGAVPPQEAVIFDMDGVVTDTAAVHAAAWKRLFDDVLADPRLSGGPYAPFDITEDYRLYVDGRAREDGVAAFLAARRIDLPTGGADDGADAWSVRGLAARKNAMYLHLLAEQGLRVFPGTVDLLRRLRAGGVPVGLVTASRNAQELLAAAGLGGIFDVVVDGREAHEMGLPGKPDPAMFLRAAELLGVDPARAAVVEDALAGVRGARTGGFGLVVGVDRVGQREALEEAGADVVVADVSELDLGSLRTDPWTLVYEGFDPAHEPHREALTTLGNGYLGTRGAAPERAADGVHYPGTYLAGVYNRLTSTVHGRDVEDEHLVNAPNWLLLDLRVGGGGWWSAGGLTAADERRELDLRRGVLTRTAVLTDGAGRRLRLTQHRIVSMARPHLACLETTLEAQGWDGAIGVASGIDGGVRNRNVAEYRGLADRHLRTVAVDDVDENTLLVEVETTQSQVRVATAARTTVTGPDAAPPVHEHHGDRHVLRFDLTLQAGRPVTITKTVAVFTSKDHAIASAPLAAVGELKRAAGGLAGLLPAHEAAWARLWDRFAIELDADRQTQLVLNLHVFHLLQSVSAHTADVDAGVPARGLHGEGYRGHVFWDELFVLPALTAHLPWVSRALLEYRYRRLDAARRAAAEAGRTGAMFPWQSGSDGREETPSMLFNTRSGRWMPDNSRRQRHVGLAVAYNAWQYYQATGDVAWLAHRGADLIIEVARFFASLATYDGAEDRFHIVGVMGPDEYHDGYPGAPGQGLRDNAYTNVLAAWVCARATEVLHLTDGHECDEVYARLGVRPEEPELWQRLGRRLAVPFHDGVLSQFDGYGALAELDWAHYRRTYGNIGRLDLILEAEGDTTNRYRLAKQADVLMLVYLLGPDGVLTTLERLGYPADRELLARTVDYYLARTAHGSTLSRVVHASVLARMDPVRAWQTFRDALAADLDDTQGGTTGEGVHLGAMAGTIDIVTRAFAGQRTEGDTVALDPNLPVGLRRARFSLVHRGQRLRISLDHDSLTVSADPCAANPRVRVGGRTEAVSAAGKMLFIPSDHENGGDERDD